MRKVIVFGTPTCPDCPPVKEAFTEAGVKFAYVDVCESVGSLKKFLKMFLLCIGIIIMKIRTFITQCLKIIKN